MEEFDFRQMRLDALRRRNAKNKARARAMEQRIAKYLNGTRVPLSGAGGIKGDVMAPSPYGTYLVECKLSEGWSKPLNCECLTTSFAILDKLEREAVAMRFRFGVLVFHYHNVRADYVIIRSDWFRMINPAAQPLDSLGVEKQTKTLKLPIQVVNNWLTASPNPWFYVATPTKEYAVLDIKLFKSLVQPEDDVYTPESV